MKTNATSYRLTREIEAEIEAIINEHTPAFRKRFKPFRRELLRTAAIESIIERFTDAGIPRQIALWHMSNQKTVRMPFSTKHPDYSLAEKMRGPTLADKIKNGTVPTGALCEAEMLGHYDAPGNHEAHWMQAILTGDFERNAMGLKLE